MTLLDVRAAGPADRNTLSALGAATYRSHFTAIWSKARLEAYVEAEYGPVAMERSLADAGALWLLAELAGEAVGFAKVNWNRPLPVGTGSGAELQKIYFRADLTGQGHGAALLAAVIDRARMCGARRVWLDVLKSNTGARSFYERHGFSAIGDIPFATDLGEIGMWVMARDL